MSTTTMTETTKSKLVEAIECGQFQAIPDLCESMAYELALKTDMLVDAIAKRSQAELQQILIDDGGRISCYQHEAAHTITRAMHLMFRADTEEIFERWLLTPPGAAMARDGIMLGVIVVSDQPEEAAHGFLGVRVNGVQWLHLINTTA